MILDMIEDIHDDIVDKEIEKEEVLDQLDDISEALTGLSEDSDASAIINTPRAGKPGIIRF